VTTIGRVHPSPPPPRVRRWSAVVGVVALLAAGCSVADEAPAGPATDPSEAPIASSTPDPARDALLVEVRRLTATVAAAREELATALDAEGPTSARQAGRDTLTLLVAESGPDDTTADEVRPLFPAESLGRDDLLDAPDQLTNTLTAARDVGGALGRAVVDLLRDPVAGDLGSWERDAAGVLVGVEATTREASDLEGLEQAITGLGGLGTQAIAWAQLTAEASSTEDARAFAERGLASLDTIVVGIDLIDLGEDEPSAEDEAEADVEVDDGAEDDGAEDDGGAADEGDGSAAARPALSGAAT
jgi:hypothetical protein